MIGLDTNVLLRFIAKDDWAQTRRVRKIIEAYRGKQKSVYISDISLCETVWTLKSAYKYSKIELIAVLENLSDMEELSFSDLTLFKQATELYKNGKADFADYFLALKNKQVGCEFAYSFDNQLIKESLATPISH